MSSWVECLLFSIPPEAGTIINIFTLLAAFAKSRADVTPNHSLRFRSQDILLPLMVIFPFNLPLNGLSIPQITPHFYVSQIFYLSFQWLLAKVQSILDLLHGQLTNGLWTNNLFRLLSQSWNLYTWLLNIITDIGCRKKCVNIH